MRLAHVLEGEKINDEWQVIKKIEKRPDQSGGMFSICYFVEHINSKEQAFLKAIDYSELEKTSNFLKDFRCLTDGYEFECMVLEICKNSYLDKIVVAKEYGEFKKDGYMLPANYMIFELADGTIRDYLNCSEEIDIIMILKSLHDTVVGLNQLHSQMIVHQDLKPSNILVYGKQESKVGDLGRAGMKGYNPPHEDLPVAGDYGYAPIEHLYGYIHPDWKIRRVGGDLYSFGNLIFYYFMDVSLTNAILSKIPRPLNYRFWRGTYSEIIDYLNDATSDALLDLSNKVKGELGRELSEMISQLCNTSVEDRGHPKNKGENMNSYSLERYIAKLDILLKKAEANTWRNYE